MTLNEYMQISEEKKRKLLDELENQTSEQDIPIIISNNSDASVLFDGPIVNRNPLTEIPEPEMRLFGVDKRYFEKRKEVEAYSTINGISEDNIFILDYIRTIVSRTDVIRKTYLTQIFKNLGT